MYTENHHSSPEDHKNNHNPPLQALKRKKRPLQRKPLPEKSSLEELHNYPPLSPQELEQMAHKGELLREEGEDRNIDLPSGGEWSTQKPPDLQLLLDADETSSLPVLETTIEMGPDTAVAANPIPRERRIFSESPTDLPYLGFPPDLNPSFTRMDTTELNAHRAHELEKQLASFDQHINKLQQEEQKTWFKGAIQKRLEQARQAREAIWNAHEELLKEIKGDHLGILQNIETQLTQQREKIRHLQSSYDKAWFRREEKRQKLEQAKTQRNDLLKKRMEVRTKAGIIDTESPVIMKNDSENKLETLLENIKKELEEKRKNVLRLKSLYDKAWFWSGRKEKRDQFEKAKKEFIVYGRKLKETYKEQKELNDYLETVDKALFDE